MYRSTRGLLIQLAAVAALAAAGALAAAVLSPLIARGDSPPPASTVTAPGRVTLTAPNAADLRPARPGCAIGCNCTGCPACPCATRAATLEHDRNTRDRSASKARSALLFTAGMLGGALLVGIVFFWAMHGAVRLPWIWAAVTFGSIIATGADSARADLSRCIDATCRLTRDIGGGRRTLGTGCTIRADADAVLVLTCAHVTGPAGTDLAAEFWHRGYQSRPFPARVIWTSYRDAGTTGIFRDVAIVAVDPRAFVNPATGQPIFPPTMPLAPPALDLRTGDTICTVGCPEGSWPSAVVGHVLRTDRGKQTGAVADFLPVPLGGRSGSAVFDAAGEQIVGVLAWAAKDSPDQPEPTHGRLQTAPELWAAFTGANPLSALDLGGQPVETGGNYARFDARPTQCPGGNCFPWGRRPNQNPTPTPGPAADPPATAPYSPFPGLPSTSPGPNATGADYATRPELDALAGRVTDLEALRADVTDQAAATAIAQAQAEAAAQQAQAATAAASTAQNTAAAAQLDAADTEQKTAGQLQALALDVRNRIDDARAAGQTDAKLLILGALKDTAVDRAPDLAGLATQALGLGTPQAAAIVAAAWLLRRRVNRRRAARTQQPIDAAGGASPATFRTTASGPFRPRA